MISGNLQNKIQDLIEPIITALGYELWGVELFLQGKHTLLRIYIEVAKDIDGKSNNISIDDCSKVSHEIGAILDVEDLMVGRYSLEVSSPGMDRRLFKREQYERYIGSIIGVRLSAPEIGGENSSEKGAKQEAQRRNYTGKLLAVENEAVQLSVDNNIISLPIEHIEKAHLVPEF